MVMHRASHDTISTRKSLTSPSPSHTNNHPNSSSQNTSNHSSLHIPNGSPVTTKATKSISTRRAVPGRPRRRTVRNKKTKSLWKRCGNLVWCQDVTNTFSSLFLAVLLWYTLGVLSIGSSKVLLQNSGVPPLFLTLQQLWIGSSLLQLLLRIHFLNSPGLMPLPATTTSAGSHTPGNSSSRRNPTPGSLRAQPKRQPFFFSRWASSSTFTNLNVMLHWRQQREYFQPLVLTGVFFCLGFLATNYGFSGSSAAYVETVKAAEPITSALIAVGWGIERLSQPEWTSLGVIVTGVLFSTLGNQHSSAAATAQPHMDSSIRACMIVIGSNLCFSLRGLYQKLLRATNEGSAQTMDDLNLQYRMQQMGCYLLALPVLLFNGPLLLQLYYTSGRWNITGILQYCLLALVNGCAFASYNLASTFILSRISVVHHAALNCIRRIFAIIVTSIIFEIPITWMGALGILISVFGFMSFTHFKVQRQRQPKPVSSLLPVSASVNNA